MLDGAVYKYKCKEGYPLVGYGSVFCDGVRWSHDKPECEGRYDHIISGIYRFSITERLNQFVSEKSVPSPLLLSSSVTATADMHCLIIVAISLGRNILERIYLNIMI